MFVPPPIDENYVPYTKRRVSRRNAALFVDPWTAGESSGAARVGPQSDDCAGQPVGTTCGIVYTSGGQRYRRTCSSDGECDGPLVPL
jgi:hypothetical protein